MLTKEDTYKQAFEIKKSALKEKEKHRSMMLAAAYAANPRIKEIENELAALGASLAVTALSGDTAAVADIKKRSSALSLEKKAIFEKSEVKDIVYDCALCKDTGLVNGKICECMKKLAAELTMKNMSQEMPIKDCRFDNFNLNFYEDINNTDGSNPRRRMTSILNTCMKYVDDFTPKGAKNLLFMGNVGLGKTHLSLAVAAGIIKKGYTPIYGSAENLFAKIENERFGGENRGVGDAMLKCDLLIIDDLGTELETKSSKAMLYNLINTRLLAEKPIIINTNLTMRELEDRYTARLSSRLMGNFDCNRFIGNDIRQKKAMKN